MNLGSTATKRPNDTEIQKFNYGDTGRVLIDAANTCGAELKLTRFQINTILDELIDGGHIAGLEPQAVIDAAQGVEVNPDDYPQTEDVTAPEAAPEPEPEGEKKRGLGRLKFW